MAGSFSGKRFPLLILLVSLFSSVHAILENFNQIVRAIPNTVNTHNTENIYQTKPKPQSFYQQNEPGVGLYPSPPPPTHTPPPPYKNHYKTNAPPPPPPPRWFPKNYNPSQYITNAKDQNLEYNPDIIEDEEKYKEGTTEFDLTDFAEDEEVPSPTKKYFPGSFYQQHKKSLQTKTKQGMSDTKFLENGKYYFSLEDNNFSSNEHPFNTINKQYSTNNQKYNEPLDSENYVNEDDEQP